MRRRGEILFAAAFALALALYGQTTPDGLPWNESTHLALAYLGEIVRLQAMPHPFWGFYVRVCGGPIALSVILASVAAGLLATVVNRHFGWRLAASAALVWIFLPGVWNRAITGERGICLAAMVVVTAWALNAVALRVLKKARAARKAGSGADGVRALPGTEQTTKRAKVNRIAGWVALGAAGLFAAVSLTLHDYWYGEAASAFARGVVYAAEGRVIVLNGVCDGQIVREVKRKSEKGNSADVHSSTSHFDSLHTIALRNDDAYRTNLLAWVRSAFPTETNLWVAAQVSPQTFVEAATRKFPERFYLMNGKSTTHEAWERRWEAFKPYLESSDPFVRTARRMFGYEGNAVGNAMLDECEKVKRSGEGEQRNCPDSEQARRNALPRSAGQPSGEAASQPLNQDESGAKRHVHSSASTPDFNSSKAWRLYKRIYTEVDPGNFSALVNMSEMIRRGYAACGDEKKAVQEKLETFFRDANNRKHMREIARAAGPVRVDPERLERMAAEAKKRLAERIASGEKVEINPEVLSLIEWNNEMCRLMDKGELVKAGRIARAILSNPKWHGFVPANAVMGAVAASEGDDVSSERFFRVAAGATNTVATIVLNDYADTLMRLGKLDEAEKVARRSVGQSEESFWLARLTLAEVLEERSKVKGEGREGMIDEGTARPTAGQRSDEIRALLKSVLKHAPEQTRERIRKEHKGYVR